MTDYILTYSYRGGGWQQKSLKYGTYIIGRAADCDIHLPEDGVSRRHAQLELSPTECCLMDMGSANGTLLEGEPLFPRRKVSLLPGQTFSIFAYQLRLHPAESLSHITKADVTATVADVPIEAAAPMQPATPAKPAQQFRLRYRQGNTPWQESALPEGETVIGREAGCQITIDSKMISRRHASLTVREGQVWVTDLGSRNGIFQNGQQLTPYQAYPIRPGDTFQIDDLTFELVLPQPATIVSATPLPSALPYPPTKQTQEPSACVTPTDSTVEEIAISQMSPLQVLGGINLAGQERFSVGRAADNQLVLNHPMVSRYHALFERMGTRTRLTDLHSANGVYVNGAPIKDPVWLKPNDVIKIGPYQMNFTGNELQHSAVEEGYAIDVIGVNKWVSKNTNLLKDISLSVGPNEFVALVGMSGAGKSTLMDAVNGFRPATHGKVLINGIDLYQNYGMFRDDIGNVPQRDIVHMELTPTQALDYSARLRMPKDTTASERKKAVEDTLEDLGLTFRKDVPISKLSGGQLKRVSIGVELLTKPRLFFLDEPTSGLDPGTEYEMMKLMRRLADQGRTIILITHATKNVMFCDRAIILAKGGNLAWFGPPEEALIYFDGFRTDRERKEKDMEFDDIYRILQDEKRGKPEEWRERFLKSPYAKYVQPRYQQPPSQTQMAGTGRQQRGRRIGAIQQFLILSARTIRCMTQDKASLGLTLALAPVLGLMNFIWGRNLFDPVHGDSMKVMSMWFTTAVIAILVGAMGSMREIVKESDIYKRERAVGLKILPYVLSKVWIGLTLSIYNGFFVLLFAVLLVRPAVSGPGAYLALLITMILGVACGYMLGLVISALVPNQNSAQIVLIAFLVPQLLFAGMLMPLDKIPLGNIISPLISTRWTFEAFIVSTGMGDALTKDPCWNLPPEMRNKLTSKQKEKCFCMGPNIFINCASFPGIRSEDFYDENARIALARGEPPRPSEPTRLPSPTPLNTPTQWATPTPLPTPTPVNTPTRLPYPVPNPAVVATDAANSGRSVEEETAREAHYRANQYKINTEKQMEEYRQTREAQFNTYKEDTMQQFDEYQYIIKTQIAEHIESQTNAYESYGNAVEQQFRDYEGEMEAYAETIEDWEKNRLEAIGSAETILSLVYNDYGHAFRGTAAQRWLYTLLISFGEFLIILGLMKRKDTI